jgi:hypothetical protein
VTIALSAILSGTIGSYGDLVSKVALWLDRDDLTPRIPDFIALLEARLNRDLRTNRQETAALWQVSAGGFTLPPDFRRMRQIFIDGAPNRPLVEMAPQAISAAFNGAAGTPRAYWIENRVLRLAPPPAAAVMLSATYFTRIPPLTVDAGNWLLTEHPDIYLIGTLLEAAVYIRDEDAMAYLADRLDTAVVSLQIASRLDRWGGGPLVPGGAPAQVRGARC